MLQLAINTTANEYTTINNTGNGNLTGRVAVEGMHLYSGANYLSVGNISSDIESGINSCSGFNLINGTNVTITTTILERGNLSEGGAVGQEVVYYCLTEVPTNLPSGTYDTSNTGAWIIRIVASFVIAYVPGRKRKKKKLSKDDRLVKVFDLVMGELKESYSINKKEIIEKIISEIQEKYKITRKEIFELIDVKELKIPITIFNKNVGALESLTKYMKENLNMNYSQIAKLVKRDDRTIWTAYKKACEKYAEPFIIKETEVYVPLEIFGDRNLTVLESVIVYLKNKSLSYKYISELVDRDQRNVWTIYSNALRKV
jgi:hypothetical protein